MIIVVGDGILFASTVAILPASNPVPFNHIETSRGHQWDRTTQRFSIKEAAGLYMVALSVGVPRRQQANYILEVSGRKFGGITRTSRSTSVHSQEIISHDFLIQLYAADTLHVSSEYSTISIIGSEETSLSLFSITYNMVNETVAFSMAMESTISGHIEPVPFNVHLYNSGLHYHPLSHTYTAPSAGVYYFSFSVGLIANETAEFVLYKNVQPYASIVRKSTIHDGTDTIGRAVMMRLDQGDMIYMVNEAGQIARSSPMMETSFSGFKYEPRHRNMVC